MKIFCVICNSDVESESSKHQKWQLESGTVEGWGCHRHWNSMGAYHEFTTDAILEGRKEHRKDMIQRFRQGEFSKEFADEYPSQTAAMVKDGIITTDQVKKAKEVWRGDL